MARRLRSTELRLADLWDTVINLSLKSKDQVALLDELGCEVDELALDFDDSFSVANEAVVKNLLNNDEFSELYRLNKLLDSISGEQHADKWTRQALRQSEVWNEIRAVALGAIAKRQLAKIRELKAKERRGN